MERFENLPIGELIRKDGFDCTCGRHHGVDLKYIKIERGALNCVPEAVKALNAKKPFIVCDKNTYAAAAKRVTEILAAAGVEYTLFEAPEMGRPKLEPDEMALGSIAMNFDTSCDMIMAVGGGVINDLCKVFAFDTGRPQMIVGTAPSMDGFASNSSSMVVDGVKLTLYNRCPQAIVLDTEVLAQAPMRMLWAGLGDMVAKYISVCEWRIAHIVIEEYYCEHVAQLMRNALKRIMAAADHLAERDPDSVGAVAEGLVLSGFAMSFAKVSRPASGLEHYFSHMWEMMALERGHEADLHGIQVGVGTLLTLWIYENVLNLDRIDTDRARRAMAAFSPEAWEAQARRIFGPIAPEILALERKAHKNDPARHEERLQRIEASWPAIRQIIREELPSRESIRSLMAACGLPLTPADLGLTEEDTVDALLGSRDIRDKYLTSSLLWDLGLLEDTAQSIRAVCRDA